MCPTEVLDDMKLSENSSEEQSAQAFSKQLLLSQSREPKHVQKLVNERMKEISSKLSKVQPQPSCKNAQGYHKPHQKSLYTSGSTIKARLSPHNRSLKTSILKSSVLSSSNIKGGTMEKLPSSNPQALAAEHQTPAGVKSSSRFSTGLSTKTNIKRYSEVHSLKGLKSVNKSPHTQSLLNTAARTH